MPGIAGILSRSLPTDQALALCKEMTMQLMHERDNTSGHRQFPESGLTVGWVNHPKAYSDCPPIWDDTKSFCLIFHGNDFSDQKHRNIADLAPTFFQEFRATKDAAFRKLNGWFCGVVIDVLQREIFLFNDRFALKRLYIHRDSQATYFSSEAKSLLRVFPELRRIDPVGLTEWLGCGATLQNRTLFKGVRLLPPASAWIFKWRGDSLSESSYFNPSEWEDQPLLSEDEFDERLRVGFATIVERYVVDGETGMSLTGGVDGRMIMAWLSRTQRQIPCYTFNGPVRDCVDVRIARKIAEACHQKHSSLNLSPDFFRDFPSLAEQVVRISDGSMDVSGAAELYMNRLAKQVAPIRLTGNYGSEVMRHHLVLRPPSGIPSVFAGATPTLQAQVRANYFDETKVHPLSFIAFKQVPWYHYARLSIEQSQIDVRSPFLDNDLLKELFRAPRSVVKDRGASWRLISSGNRRLAQIPTDRGTSYSSSGLLASSREVTHKLKARFEYAWDYGMPHWLARVDRILSPFKVERLFLGNQKFCHYRTWYRRQLAPFVSDTLLDSLTLSRSYLDKRQLKNIVTSHIKGTANHTLTLHKLLSVELLHRSLLD